MQVRPFALPRPRRYDELRGPPGAGLNANWLAGEVVSRETDSGSAEMLCLAATTHGKDATEVPTPPGVAAICLGGTTANSCGLEPDRVAG